MSDTERLEAAAAACERCSKPHDHSTETCCSSHGKRLCHACYRRTHFVHTCPCGLCVPAVLGVPASPKEQTDA